MAIKINNIDEITVLTINDATSDKITETIKNAVADTIFFLDENGVFQGIMTVGDYIRQTDSAMSSYKINRQCKYLYDGQNVQIEAKKFCIH